MFRMMMSLLIEKKVPLKPPTAFTKAVTMESMVIEQKSPPKLPTAIPSEMVGPKPWETDNYYNNFFVNQPYTSAGPPLVSKTPKPTICHYGCHSDSAACICPSSGVRAHRK